MFVQAVHCLHVQCCYSRQHCFGNFLPSFVWIDSCWVWMWITDDLLYFYSHNPIPTLVTDGQLLQVSCGRSRFGRGGFYCPGHNGTSACPHIGEESLSETSLYSYMIRADEYKQNTLETGGVDTWILNDTSFQAVSLTHFCLTDFLLLNEWRKNKSGFVIMHCAALTPHSLQMRGTHGVS